MDNQQLSSFVEIYGESSTTSKSFFEGIDQNGRNDKHLMELKNIFYITVNQLNGHFYFGVHLTNPDVFDGYIGCGV